jgi:putative oxidoreductase
METKNKAWNISLWILQVLLAALFAMSGFGKVSQPIADLAKQMAWVTAVPEGLVRFIGTAELAGALGLILPSVTRIKPVLTAWAGIGLATIMVLALPFHLSRGEMNVWPVNVVLGSLAALLAWGRFKKAPIQSKH